MGNGPSLLHQTPPSLQLAVTVRVDTLNDLPDEILTHILSFLPYKEAFRTRILSKRWLPLCHSVSVLNINDEGVNSAKDWTHFHQFMDAIMFSPHSQNIPLKSFHLTFRYKFWDDNIDCSTFGKWIEAAKQCRVEYLNLLNIPLAPTTIFCCKTLVVLRLMSIRVANMFCCSVDLPLLKTLDLFNVRFDDMENLMRLISGCPVLENLKTSSVEGSAGVIVGGYFKPLSKLIKAHIKLFEVPLRAVYNVRFLTIFQMGKIHRNEEISSYYKGFPVFGNLTILQLYWGFELEGIHDWDEVVKMLQNCPKLQTLKIVKWRNSTTKEGWKNPCHVPECVSSQLRTCKIEGYKAVKADFGFATYIMQNARLLQVMTICRTCYQNSIGSPKFFDDLSHCPRISPACKLCLSSSN